MTSTITKNFESVVDNKEEDMFDLMGRDLNNSDSSDDDIFSSSEDNRNDNDTTCSEDETNAKVKAISNKKQAFKSKNLKSIEKQDSSDSSDNEDLNKLFESRSKSNKRKI